MQPHTANAFESEIRRFRANPSMHLHVVGFDFDGTLVPEIYPHSNRIISAAELPRQVLNAIAQQEGVIPCLSTGCSFGEALQIVKNAFCRNNEPYYGFCSSEHGATLFCPLLPPDIINEIRQQFEYPIEVVKDGEGEAHVVILSKLGSDDIFQRVILPAVRTIPKDVWASSACDLNDPKELGRLYDFSGHLSPEWTLKASRRFGSAYVKIAASYMHAATVASHIVRNAAENGVYAILTPPKPTHPFFTVDIAPGTDKGSALQLAVQLTAAITRRQTSDLRVSFFGNGENDFKAFDFVRNHNRRLYSHEAFLVDTPTGDNHHLAVQTQAAFVRGKANIEGVLEGLRLLGLLPFGWQPGMRPQEAAWSENLIIPPDGRRIGYDLLDLYH